MHSIITMVELVCISAWKSNLQTLNYEKTNLLGKLLSGLDPPRLDQEGLKIALCVECMAHQLQSHTKILELVDVSDEQPQISMHQELCTSQDEKLNQQDIKNFQRQNYNVKSITY